MSADNEDPRPHKWLRLAEDSTSLPSNTPPTGDLSNLTRHEEFWFDDRSIILVAQNTGFRVFRSLLAAQSTVFSDMFSSSSPHAEEMFEGCPVVHLSDSPHDVAHFLSMLFLKSQRMLYVHRPSFSFPRISAIIRLAHKYLVQDVLNRAILALEEYFTDDFNIWEAEKTVITLKRGHAIVVVNLARLVDRPSMLPTAFYECALLGANVLRGCSHEDKSVEYLTQRDVMRCIDGWNKLAAKAIALISELFVNQPCTQCKTHSHCEGALKTILEVAIASDHASDPDVLSSWQDVIKCWATDYYLCDACDKAMIERDTAAHRKVWGELLEIFGLKVEGWNSNGGIAAVVDPPV